MSDAFWSIDYLSEALKKHRVFYTNFQKRQDELEKAFARQGQTGIRWWQFYLSLGLLNPAKDPDLERRMDVLISLLHRMRLLTIYAPKFLQELNLLSGSALEAEFAKHGRSLSDGSYRWFTDIPWRSAAKEYNKLVAKEDGYGSGLIRTTLPEELCPGDEAALSNWAINTLKITDRTFQEVERVLEEYCPRYKVQEGGLEFAPDSNTRVLIDGSTEQDLDDIFVLTLDIIGSTDSAQARIFKEEVRTTFRRFADRGVVFEETRNDAYVACCREFLILVEISRSLRVRAETLMKSGDTFMGTRKGISFGSLRVVKKKDGYMVGDKLAPDLLPRAFGMVELIDKEVARNRINSQLLIESAAWSRIASKTNLISSGTVSGTTKHFHGSGVLVNLD
jgi:hypothetical protein